MTINLEYHIRADCKWCGWLNHVDVPIIAKDGKAQIRCQNCHKYFLEMHAKESEL